MLSRPILLLTGRCAALSDIPLTHPKLLAAMRHVLGDKIALSSLNFRQALPGSGHQSFHTDWGPNPDALNEPPEFSVCNSLWMLECASRALRLSFCPLTATALSPSDFHEVNGST